ncbi:MAG: S8 family serine peptidase [Chlorobiaceae bacterium]|nr:S8 family serine peptidase [Chlorobiaceae bacterium]
MSKHFFRLVLRIVFSGFALTMIAFSALATDIPLTTTAPTPEQLWGLRMIGHDRAVEAGFTGNGIVVGVVDDIIYVNHPEFSDRVIATYNSYGTPYEPGNTDYHSTHVAGIAVGKNVGVATKSGMVGINVISGAIDANGNVDYHIFDANTASSYAFGLSNGVQVFNNSWILGEFFDGLTAEMFQSQYPGMLQAYRNTTASGSVLVLGAGNSSQSQPALPAGLPYYFPELQPYWIAVVAVGPDRKITWYSNKAGVGAEWSISAPGGIGNNGSDTAIWSSMQSNQYGSQSGTSMATPHVTGTVAVTYEIFPKATSPEVVQMVLQTATDLGEPGVDPVYGWGLLNLGNIVATIEPRTAGSFANATWSRFVTMDHMGKGLRQHLATASSVPGNAASDPAITLLGGQGQGGANISATKAAAVWVVPIYGDASLDLGSASQPAHAVTTGAWFGIDLVNQNTAQFGLAAGLSRTDLNTTTSADNGLADSMHLGIFGSRSWEDWLLEGSGQFAWMGQTLSRHEIAGTAGTARLPVGQSDYKSQGIEMALNVIRKYTHESGWSIAPYASLSCRWQKTDAFDESEARIFNLKVSQSMLNQFEPGVGFRWKSVPLVKPYGTLWLSMDLGYSLLLGDRDHSTQVTLLGRMIQGSTTMIGRDVFNFGGRLNYAKIGRVASGFLGYQGRIQQNGKQHTVLAGIDVKL